DVALAVDHPSRDTGAPPHRLEPIDPAAPDAGTVRVLLWLPAFLDVYLARPILRSRRHHCRRHGTPLYHRGLCEFCAVDPSGRYLHDCHDQAPGWQMVAAPASPGLRHRHRWGCTLSLAGQSRYPTTAALWRYPGSTPVLQFLGHLWPPVAGRHYPAAQGCGEKVKDAIREPAAPARQTAASTVTPC